jgi:hypothetical protein
LGEEGRKNRLPGSQLERKLRRSEPVFSDRERHSMNSVVCAVINEWERKTKIQETADWDRCYGFLNIFAKKSAKKWEFYDSKQSLFM